MGIFDFFSGNNDYRDDRSSKQNYSIAVNRDSVNMGDDCSGHSREMRVDGNLMLSSFLSQLTNYVPAMNNVIWAVRSNMGPCGYIITDNQANATIRLSVMDTSLKNTGINSVFCKYYYPDLFYTNDPYTGRRMSKYPECSTFFEMVKRENEF